jgi:3-oxoacyl-[acyl-carrier protein] reductase
MDSLIVKNRGNQQTSLNRPLHGRTAIVTGSGRNIGKAMALRLAAQGANVVVNGRGHEAELEAVVDQARAFGVGAMSVRADVGNPDAVHGMVQAAAERFGKVDVAVANVSLRMHRPFLEITDDDWNVALATNLSSAFYLARACLPYMIAGRWGRIVSISGRDGFFPAAARAPNVASKGGIHALMKAIAVEFGRQGITANTIAPGIVDTARDLANYPDAAKLFESRLQATAVGRWGTVDDIADACSYLCSPAGAFVTGQVLHVSGGEFMC